MSANPAVSRPGRGLEIRNTDRLGSWLEGQHVSAKSEVMKDGRS